MLKAIVMYAEQERVGLQAKNVERIDAFGYEDRNILHMAVQLLWSTSPDKQ